MRPMDWIEGRTMASFTTSPTRNVSLLAFLLSIFLVPVAFPAQGAEAPARMMVGYGAISAVSTAVWVAREAKTFEKYGLDTALLYVASASKMDQAVVSGDVHVALTGGSSVVDAVLAGADLVVIGGVFNTPAFYIMGRPEIETVADLKGKKVGVTRIGSSTDYTIRLVLKKFGLEPNKDVAILQLGGTPEIAAALGTGVISGAALSSPTNITAQRMGAHLILDMAKAGIAFPHSVIISTRRYISKNRPAVAAFTRAYGEALNIIFSNPQATKQALRKYARLQDQEIIDATYDYALAYLQKPPVLTVEGFQLVLDTLAARQAKAREMKPSAFLDSSFVNDLIKEGFYK